MACIHGIGRQWRERAAWTPLRGGLALRRFARSRGGVRTITKRVAVTTREIIERRLIVPAVEVLADLLSPSKEHLMADPASLQQAEATLEAMLTDWLRDRESTLSSDEIAALSAPNPDPNPARVLAPAACVRVRMILSSLAPFSAARRQEQAWVRLG